MMQVTVEGEFDPVARHRELTTEMERLVEVLGKDPSDREVWRQAAETLKRIGRLEPILDAVQPGWPTSLNWLEMQINLWWLGQLARNPGAKWRFTIKLEADGRPDVKLTPNRST